MNLNDHSRLRGKHALLSPSNPSFLSKTPDEIRNYIYSGLRSELGSLIHKWAFYKIESRSRVTSARDAARSLRDYIFQKYYIEERRVLASEGKRLLKVLSKLPKEVLETVCDYINDAIGFRMTAEVIVAISDLMFGTSDAIIFNGKMLRVHDLKTGSTAAKIEQLLSYDAIFCYEYNINPFEIEHEVRIYQNGDILVSNPTGEIIQPIVDKLIVCEQIANEFEEVPE